MSGATEASLRCQIKSGRYCVLHSGKIYDLTDFADRHPGGKELIEKHVGKDVTQVMKSDATHKHSPSAYKIMDRYYIGEYHSVNGITHRQTNGHSQTNGHVELKEHTNGHANGHTNGHANGHTNGHINGYKNGYTNGSTNKNSNSELQQYDDMIDWSRPVFWQVGALGDKYEEWVHSPIDSSLWLFENPIVEYFSKAYWWTILIYWVPVLCYLLNDVYTSFMQEPVIWELPVLGDITLPVMSVPLLVILGVVFWTLDEYIVHRWLFHCRPPSSSKFLITLHFLFHGQHHKSPMDKCRLVFPVVPATLLASFIYTFYRAIAPTPIAHACIAGTIIGYLAYDLTHYYLHHGSPSLAYFKNLKTYHVKHHFKTQNRGFGISSKIWDYPFGTLIR